MKKYILNIILPFLVTLSVHTGFAQNAGARYEIDAKRISVSVTDKDALPRSREFIRLDSTYYVGYYFEGMYKHERAADYLGYRNCILPLKRSLSLFEKDFVGNLKTSVTAGTPDARFIDIQQICTALYDSYSNIEKPDSAIWVLEKVKSWELPYDFMEYHIKSAWTIHRNRYYLGKYAFLKNTVEENEQLALNHLYQALAEGNTTANFYLAIIHNYLQNIDSTKYYYDYLMQNGGMSYNNYAHFKNTLGEFALATDNFEKEKFAFDKRLIESYYFLPTLYIMSGNSLRAITETNDIIAKMGSTPGFGWYNIALARSYLYNGQLDSAQKAIDKAAQFKELHLGTTLGQSQYDFAINVVKLLVIERKMQSIQFFNSGWWYSIKDLGAMTELLGQKFLLRFAIVNEFANNPERQNVIYTLFSSENVIGFDEIWNLIKDISPEYFKTFYQQKMQQEKRENVIRYMKLFYADFLYLDGDKKESRAEMENILYNTLLDTAHEKLFLGRLYEGLAKNYDNDGDDQKLNTMLFYLHHDYPQLIPYSGLKMKVKLTAAGLVDDQVNIVRSELSDCNIAWVSEGGPYTLLADITFEKKKDKYEVIYSARYNSGEIAIPSQHILFKKGKGVGKELAMRLFGSSGPVEMQTE
ncbi:MAG: hypothetical protein H0W12_08730 [Chitinophagaceae bacterium]|nr:hypothetical protein [Chitinophagaceae bacterium]